MEIERRTANSGREGGERVGLADQIVVTTNFLYKNYRQLPKGQERTTSDTDGIRGDLALLSIEKAMEQGVRFVACDAGSSADFLAMLAQFQEKGLTIVASDIQGRAPQRRAAFRKAIALPDAKAILYIQAEKVGVLEHLAAIMRPIIEGDADVVVLARNPQLFEQSYPGYMRESELRVNKTYNGLMRRLRRYDFIEIEENFDWFFGPVAFRNDPKIAALFLKQYYLKEPITSSLKAETNPEKHSGNHYFPIIEALFNKYPVVGIEIPFVYPHTQRANEESPDVIEEFQRRRTLDGVSYRLEALHFLAYLRGDSRSKIEAVATSPHQHAQ